MTKSKRIVAALAVAGALAALPASATAGGPPPPPNCETGQTNAFINTLINGSDNPFDHADNVGDCFYGLSPGNHS